MHRTIQETGIGHEPDHPEGCQRRTETAAGECHRESREHLRWGRPGRPGVPFKTGLNQVVRRRPDRRRVKRRPIGHFSLNHHAGSQVSWLRPASALASRPPQESRVIGSISNRFIRSRLRCVVVLPSLQERQSPKTATARAPSPGSGLSGGYVVRPSDAAHYTVHHPADRSIERAEEAPLDNLIVPIPAPATSRSRSST